jgi:uncharacterized protein YgbK (DUF1537 family)
VTHALYSYYGDDFTGSTDVLEGLAVAGVRSVLFLGRPAEHHWRKFSDCQAFGIAGNSRSRTPEWMDEQLPGIFARLRSFGAPIVHYKTCSTFDSSPAIGSIGRAMEIGRDILKSPFVPVVVAAPHLKRYVVFGNLFAAAGNEIYRIDRHPTMRQHPVTPMHEADLRLHLARQTPLRVGLIDLPTLRSGRGAEALSARLTAGDDAVLFDGAELEDTQQTGRILWERACREPLFAVGSSGLTYGLAATWKAAGMPTAPATTISDSHATGPVTAVDRMLVMSGSCSPVTERQIAHALRNGYEGVAMDMTEFADPATSAAVMDSTVSKAIAALRRTGKVIVYSALGPLPPGVVARGDSLGRQIGAMLRDIIRTSGLRRVVLAGGDTSSHAVAQLGLYALTWVAATQPGAPLCRTHSDTPELNGLELVLKGGQVGTEDFFERVRIGGR